MTLDDLPNGLHAERPHPDSFAIWGPEGAEGDFRYGLGRRVGPTATALPRVALVIGLNPSTANAFADDPTIRRERKFAAAWGCDWLLKLNAYAYRATDPRELERTGWLTGAYNDAALHWALTQSLSTVVAAWGTKCEPHRAGAILAACSLVQRHVECLGENADGSPKHPLYLKSDTLRRAFPKLVLPVHCDGDRS